MNGLSAQKLPKRIIGLNELAYNLWWSWHQDARELFKALDRPLWKATCHNPVKLLHQVAPYRLVAAADDPAFLRKYDSVIEDFKADMAESGTWMHTNHPEMCKHKIAFFSMEFALHNSLPMYAGGLGVLAGDYCKEASDLGLPVVGVGFMYPQGYFRQRISDNGWQEEIYSQLNYSEAPITPILTGDKRTVKVAVELESRQVYVTAWRVNVGLVNLILLDARLEENSPTDQQLTARLYIGDREMRLRQEIILGIGGVRILRALGIRPSIWHSNEGHTCFMMLERCREIMEHGTNFPEAMQKVRSSTVFTTHTPVPAGNDTFSNDLIEKQLHRFRESLGMDCHAFLKLGTQDCDCNNFNMTVLGLNTAEYRNGVSQLHGAVCRRMWQSLWPDTEDKDVPIISITNGVHVPTWIAPQMARVYREHIGTDWLKKHDEPATWERIDSIPDEELWSAHRWLKSKLFSLLRDRARKRWSENCSSPVPVLAMGALLDNDVLTLGFSRRFTDYKRTFLILSDIARFKRLVQDELRPIQIVFSGKAHPSDEHGKHLVQEVFNVAKNPEFKGRIAFVEDYDIHLSRYIVPGVDVWLNTPRVFQEACGTSGMKAGLNGVPNLSVLDGWWLEGYNGVNGWAIDNDGCACNQAEQDNMDAKQLYHLLEDKIIPLYYDRDINGVPHGWLRVVKQSIRSTAHLFSARRMVKDYTEQIYMPAIHSAEIKQKTGMTKTDKFKVPAMSGTKV